MSIVQKGNKIYVRWDQLTSTEIKVEWQQNLSIKSRQYYSVPFTNKDQGDANGIVFIQKDWIDAFKNKKTSGDDFTVIVDDSFQYGQNMEKTNRWIAFHDKSMNAFQWRFIASLQSKLGGGLVDYANGFFKQYAGVNIDAIKGPHGGDPLRNF